ncbi:hypothetical protein ANN_11753 [Periplaneta americana]|uniref:Uncharacterized protein n=1 Tax=Periplaneta americana TaxID=6978 RepID=A0ABQ8T6K7_PERAM|nr:hypothetical protein ANN_11753 [Periplaneta americana]
MAGLCEGGNESSGSLKAICNQVSEYCTTLYLQGRRKTWTTGTSTVLTRYDPFDYNLFTKVKEPLRGIRYNTRDELIHALGRSQIRTTLKKKAFEDAGLPVRQIQTVQATQAPQQSMMSKSSEVTLNMLNAPESEVDVEGLPEDVKLEFEGATEEVTS